MDELMVDGNAVAGMLQEVFAVEMTTATMTCRNCGIAGEGGTRMWMDFGGMRTLEITL